MVKYHMNFLGKKTYISGFAFASIVLIFFAVLTIVILGLYWVSGWLLLASFVFSSAISINEKDYGVLPPTVRSYVGATSTIIGLISFLYHII